MPLERVDRRRLPRHFAPVAQPFAPRGASCLSFIEHLRRQKTIAESGVAHARCPPPVPRGAAAAAPAFAARRAPESSSATSSATSTTRRAPSRRRADRAVKRKGFAEADFGRRRVAPVRRAGTFEAERASVGRSRRRGLQHHRCVRRRPEGGVCVGGRRRHCFAAALSSLDIPNRALPRNCATGGRVSSFAAVSTAPPAPLNLETATVKRHRACRSRRGAATSCAHWYPPGRPSRTSDRQLLVRNIVEGVALRDIKDASCIEGCQLKIYIKQFYGVEAAIHQRVACARSMAQDPRAPRRARPPSTSRLAAPAAAPPPPAQHRVPCLVFDQRPAAPCSLGALAPPRSPNPIPAAENFPHEPRAHGVAFARLRSVPTPPRSRARVPAPPGLAAPHRRWSGGRRAANLDVSDVVEAGALAEAGQRAWCHAVIVKIGTRVRTPRRSSPSPIRRRHRRHVGRPGAHTRRCSRPLRRGASPPRRRRRPSRWPRRARSARGSAAARVPRLGAREPLGALGVDEALAASARRSERFAAAVSAAQQGSRRSRHERPAATLEMRPPQ